MIGIKLVCDSLHTGQARRSLGHKGGEWTEEKNRKLLRKIDVNGDGQISEEEFVEYFCGALPQDPSGFEDLIEQVTSAPYLLALSSIVLLVPCCGPLGCIKAQGF